MSSTSIPLGDAPLLRRAGARSRAIRLALAAGLVTAAVAAFFAARSTSLRPTPLLPRGSSGIIALDASGSVEGATLDRVYTGLSQLASSDDRFGMVVFSARAYEALPANTPARELKPLARFFRPIGRTNPGGPAAAALAREIYPANPWQAGFDTGTEISQGLQLAKSIVLAQRTRREVWLISDLADDERDYGNVARVATSYVNQGITLNVIALNPSKPDKRFFDRLLGPSGTLITVKPSRQVRLRNGHAFPLWIVVVAGIMAILLAANELWSSPLRWGSASVPGEGSPT